MALVDRAIARLLPAVPKRIVWRISQRYIAGTELEDAVHVVRRLNAPRLDSRAGNSVDTATGAFILERVVMTVTGGRTLDFPIHYNSRLTAAESDLGYG